MTKLRPYQQQAKDAVISTKVKNFLVVLPTGAGKTVLFSDVIHDHKGYAVAIAHRQELVSQISLALARDEVKHQIIGPHNVVKLCVSVHMRELGKSYYDPSAKCAVAGVDTLVRRTLPWADKVGLVVQDECHHILRDNKWGKAVKMFPNAKVLGVTATPIRADGKGLGAHADGIFEGMYVGPSMRDLILMGFLTEYKIYAPVTKDLDLSSVGVSESTGDYNPSKLKLAIRKSKVIGDVVLHYKRIANGLKGVTFATDVETARDIAKQFVEAGVPAEVVSAETPDVERVAILNRFKNGELHQLVNVDLFGEGFDLPAIEVVSMARPTESYSLFVQQFGRALRLKEGKKFAIIIDHVGNVTRHGLPDGKKTWTLDGRDKRSKNDVEIATPIKACPNCAMVYERFRVGCPYCGFIPEPSSRNAPEFVDGDLELLDESTLARLRGDAIGLTPEDVERYRAELVAKYAPDIGVKAGVKRFKEKQSGQVILREMMSVWGGFQEGLEDREIQKKFYLEFGIDVLSAQALGTSDAGELSDRITRSLLTRL